MTDWIEQTDWSTVKVGDYARIIYRGGGEETKYVFKTTTSRSGIVPGVWFLRDRRGVMYASNDDAATLYVEAKPKPVVPTEPGAYNDRNGTPWIRTSGGAWTNGHDARHPTNMAEFAPFVRLRP